MSTPVHDMIDKGAPIDEIGAWFDEQPNQARIAAATTLSKPQQSKLFDLATAERALTLDHFAPPGVDALTPIAHHGQNTLPLPHRLQSFIKWMTRQNNGIIGGYNDSLFRYLIGPGYFQMRDCEGDELAIAPVVVDYYQIPTERSPSWPFIVPNWFGPQVLVYFQTRDYMRKVSEHVTIGAAYKWDRPLNNWFTLCRED